MKIKNKFLFSFVLLHSICIFQNTIAANEQAQLLLANYESSAIYENLIGAQSHFINIKLNYAIFILLDRKQISLLPSLRWKHRFINIYIIFVFIILC